MKRFVTYSVVVATLIWAVGLGAVIPVSAYTATTGDYIKTATNTAVYYIGAEGKRHLFSNLVTFRTWENASWSSLSSSGELKVVSQADFDAIPIGANITARPGVKLVYFDDSKTTYYAVASGAKLYKIENDAAGAALFGSTWKSQAVEIQNSFRANYADNGNSAGTLTASSVLPDGSLIKYQGSDDIYYISGGKKRLVTDDAFVANNFWSSSVRTVATSMSYTTGESITAEEAALKNIDGSATGNSGNASTGTLSAALSASTPAAGIVLGSTTRNNFTKFTLTASNAGSVTIDTWKITRVGVGQDAAFSGVNIIDDSTGRTISDLDKTFNTDHIATITNNVTIPAGTTKSFTIMGTMNALGSYAGENPALQLSALELVAGTVSGLPITGNAFTLNSSISVTGATIARGSFSNASTTSSAATKIGENAYTVFAFSVTAPSGENAQLEQVKLYQTGSASLTSDMANIKLYNGLTGTFIADGVVEGSYVYFTPATPVAIEKGQIEQYKVTADIISGSDRTIKLSFYRTTDILVKGLTYNAYKVATFSSTGSSTSNPVLTDNEYYIGKGTFTVARSNAVPTGNIAIGSEQELGAFTFDVKGEALNVTALTLAITSTSGSTSDDALTAVKLVDSTGKVVAGPTEYSLSGGSQVVAFTDTFTLPVGANVYKVLGKLGNNKGWATDETIYVGINAPSTKITASGATTGQAITSDTTSNTTGNTRTVKAASLTVTRNSAPGNQTVIVGTQGIELGGWTLDATGAGEDIRITQVVVAGRGQAATNTTNLRLMDGTTQIGTTQAAITTQPNSSTFTLSTPLIVTKGTQKVIKLLGDKTTVTSNATEQWGLTDATAATNPSVVAYGKDTGVRGTVTLTADDGATVTSASSGSLTISKDGAPAEQIVIAGTTMQLVNKLRFVATNSDIDVKKMVINTGDGSTTGTAAGEYADFARVYLKSGGSFIGASAGYAVNTNAVTINLDPGTFKVTKGSTGRVLEVYANLATVGTGTDDTGTDNASVGIGIAGGTDNMTATDQANNNATPTITSTSSNYVIHVSKPVIAQTSGSVTSNTSGDNVLFTVDITATDGDVAIYRLSFLTATTDHVALTNGYVQLASCSNCTVGSLSVAAPKRISAMQSVANQGSLTAGSSQWSFALDNTDDATYTQEALVIPEGTKATLYFRAEIGGSLAWSSTSTRSIVTYMLGDSVATTTDETGGDKANLYTALNQGNFVWSDLYSDSIGSDVTTTAQWFNGYLIAGANEATSTASYTRRSY